MPVAIKPFSCLILTVLSTPLLFAQQTLEPLNRFPRMMLEWTSDQVRDAERRGEERRTKIRSQADAEAYVNSVKERIRQVFGPLPERTPLKARVTRVHERDAYRLENVIIESRPGFPVTGNLYVPKNVEGRRPAVIGVCGHSANGKVAEPYQSFAQGLARLGYVTFIIDPVGQGERFQYLGEGLKSRYGPGVSEHIQAGNQMTLVGEFLGTWMAWDGTRALDYLLSRPEVDANKVGLTGLSGGGTQTAWLCGLDERWTMAAPGCFITTFRRNVENELPADTEQCPPNALALDLDHADFLAAMAPKPVIILAQERDFFDIRGTEEAHRRLERLYGWHDKAAAVRLFTGPGYHGYSQDLREAMYRYFKDVTGGPEVAAEPALTLEKDETLWASADGRVQRETGTRTVFSFTREKAEKLDRERVELDGPALQKAVRAVLKLPQLSEVPPDYRVLPNMGARGYPLKHHATYAVETERGIHAAVTRLHEERLLSRPPRGIKRAVLYVAHRSADADLRDEALLQELIAAEPDAAVYAMDVRGTGESQPDICGRDQFLRPYGSDYFLSAHALMLGRPYLGQRTHDVLRVLQWLREQGHEEVHLAGRGWGALPAAFAALLDEGVKRVTLKQALASYSEIAQTEDYRWPYAVMLPNVLASFDLPEVYRALEGKALALKEPWGAMDGMKD